MMFTSYWSNRGFFILTGIIAVLSCSIAAQTGNNKKDSPAEILVGYEKQSWESVKQKDLKTFADFISPEFYGIYLDAENISKSMLIESLRAFDLKNYWLSDFKVTMMNKESMIVSYKVESQFIDSGKEISARAAIDSGWAKRRGKWQIVFFREITIK